MILNLFTAKKFSFSFCSFIFAFINLPKSSATISNMFGGVDAWQEEIKKMIQRKYIENILVFVVIIKISLLLEQDNETKQN